MSCFFCGLDSLATPRFRMRKLRPWGVTVPGLSHWAQLCAPGDPLESNNRWLGPLSEVLATPAQAQSPAPGPSKFKGAHGKPQA